MTWVWTCVQVTSTWGKLQFRWGLDNYVAVGRAVQCKRIRKVTEGWAAIATVCRDRLLCFKRKVEGGQGEADRMLPGGKRKFENQGGETEHDAAVHYLEEQTGITEADCEKWGFDVPISASFAYGAMYFVYNVSKWDMTIHTRQKIDQNGLDTEWLKFSKAAEQASVRPHRWKRWSAARREEPKGRMWGHIQAYYYKEQVQDR